MKIGSFGGIGVYIHWTFWLLMAVYFVSATANHGLGVGLYAGAFIISLFACVLAHEFGHAGAAAAFGIPTADITLLPIGGLARLARLPDKPYQELLIALAGPAVNVVIAAVLIIPITLGVVVGSSAPAMGGNIDFLSQLFAANVILALFNMLPAFPMDGGRVLRSLIAMRTEYLRATEIAARVGRWMALVFLILGLFYRFELLLIAAFIFFAGTAELLSVRLRSAAQPGGAPGAGGRRTVWPEHPGASPYSPFSDAAPRSGGEDDVVDAVDVRHLPRD